MLKAAWIAIALIILSICLCLAAAFALPLISASVVIALTMLVVFITQIVITFIGEKTCSLYVSHMIILFEVISLCFLFYFVLVVYSYGKVTPIISLYDTNELKSDKHFSIRIKEQSSLDLRRLGCHRQVFVSEYGDYAMYHCVSSIQPMVMRSKDNATTTVVYAWYYVSVTSGVSQYLDSRDIIKNAHYDGNVTRVLKGAALANDLKAAMTQACNASGTVPCDYEAPILRQTDIKPEFMSIAIPIISTVIGVALLLNVSIALYNTLTRKRKHRYQALE